MSCILIRIDGRLLAPATSLIKAVAHLGDRKLGRKEAGLPGGTGPAPRRRRCAAPHNELLMPRRKEVHCSVARLAELSAAVSGGDNRLQF